MKKNIKNSFKANAEKVQITSEKDSKSLAERLPSELLLNIFKYIKSYDLLFHVGRVCKRWHILAQEPTLWRTRSLEEEGCFNNSLKLLALAPTFDKVSLHSLIDQDSVVRALLHGNKNLRSLSLHFQEGSLSVQQLKTLLPHFPHLEHVDLQLPSASHDQALFTAFYSLTELLSLRLTGFVSPVSHLLSAITNYCLSLHTLHLVDCLIFFRDEHLVALVSDGRKWKSLKLVTYFISEEAYKYFASFKDLEQLALVKCKSLSDENFLKIAMLPNLKTLTISENCIITSHALTACFQLNSMQYLYEIDLTVYRADDEVAMSIATVCSHLVRLRLAMCLLTDEGLQSIIINASNLKDLDLECNIIRGLCLHLLPNYLPNLVRLNLHLCYNVLIDLNTVVARLPTLRIVDPTGTLIGPSV